MKVRPIYWYVLSGVLSLALLLGAGSHWQEMSELRQGKSAVNGQEYLQTAEKTDTAHFLDDLAYQAEGLNAELVLFYHRETAGKRRLWLSNNSFRRI